ncbi:hypothetical protein DIPPA_14709 [Diplonema papillatum]|nr:hypothetical protein DIPPA_14709 [Diplonema papillatum]
MTHMADAGVQREMGVRAGLEAVETMARAVLVGRWKTMRTPKNNTYPALQLIAKPPANLGAESAKAGPGGTSVRMIRISTDNTPEDALRRVGLMDADSDRNHQSRLGCNGCGGPPAAAPAGRGGAEEAALPPAAAAAAHRESDRGPRRAPLAGPRPRRQRIFHQLLLPAAAAAAAGGQRQVQPQPHRRLRRGPRAQTPAPACRHRVGLVFFGALDAREQPDARRRRAAPPPAPPRASFGWATPRALAALDGGADPRRVASAAALKRLSRQLDRRFTHFSDVSPVTTPSGSICSVSDGNVVLDATTLESLELHRRQRIALACSESSSRVKTVFWEEHRSRFSKLVPMYSTGLLLRRGAAAVAVAAGRRGDLETVLAAAHIDRGYALLQEADGAGLVHGFPAPVEAFTATMLWDRDVFAMRLCWQKAAAARVPRACRQVARRMAETDHAVAFRVDLRALATAEAAARLLLCRGNSAFAVHSTAHARCLRDIHASIVEAPESERAARAGLRWEEAVQVKAVFAVFQLTAPGAADVLVFAAGEAAARLFVAAHADAAFRACHAAAQQGLAHATAAGHLRTLTRYAAKFWWDYNGGLETLLFAAEDARAQRGEAALREAAARANLAEEEAEAWRRVGRGAVEGRRGARVKKRARVEFEKFCRHEAERRAKGLEARRARGAATRRAEKAGTRRERAELKRRRDGVAAFVADLQRRERVRQLRALYSAAGGRSARGSAGNGNRGLTGKGSSVDGLTASGNPVGGLTANGSPVGGLTADGCPIGGLTANGSPVGGLTADGSPIGGWMANGRAPLWVPRRVPSPPPMFLPCSLASPDSAHEDTFIDVACRVAAASLLAGRARTFGWHCFPANSAGNAYNHALCLAPARSLRHQRVLLSCAECYRVSFVDSLFARPDPPREEADHVLQRAHEVLSMCSLDSRPAAPRRRAHSVPARRCILFMEARAGVAAAEAAARGSLVREWKAAWASWRTMRLDALWGDSARRRAKQFEMGAPRRTAVRAQERSARLRVAADAAAQYRVYYEMRRRALLSLRGPQRHRDPSDPVPGGDEGMPGLFNRSPPPLERIVPCARAIDSWTAARVERASLRCSARPRPAAAAARESSPVPPAAFPRDLEEDLEDGTAAGSQSAAAPPPTPAPAAVTTHLSTPSPEEPGPCGAVGAHQGWASPHAVWDDLDRDRRAADAHALLAERAGRLLAEEAAGRSGVEEAESSEIRLVADLRARERELRAYEAALARAVAGGRKPHPTRRRRRDESKRCGSTNQSVEPKCCSSTNQSNFCGSTNQSKCFGSTNQSVEPKCCSSTNQSKCCGSTNQLVEPKCCGSTDHSKCCCGSTDQSDSAAVRRGPCAPARQPRAAWGGHDRGGGEGGDGPFSPGVGAPGLYDTGFGGFSVESWRSGVSGELGRGAGLPNDFRKSVELGSPVETGVSRRDVGLIGAERATGVERRGAAFGVSGHVPFTIPPPPPAAGCRSRLKAWRDAVSGQPFSCPPYGNHPRQYTAWTALACSADGGVAARMAASEERVMRIVLEKREAAERTARSDFFADQQLAFARKREREAARARMAAWATEEEIRARLRCVVVQQSSACIRVQRLWRGYRVRNNAEACGDIALAALQLAAFEDCYRADIQQMELEQRGASFPCPSLPADGDPRVLVFLYESKRRELIHEMESKARTAVATARLLHGRRSRQAARKRLTT